MNLRLTLSALVLLLAFPLAGCNTLKQIEVIPGAGVQVLTSPGQTAQFRAIATTQLGGESPKTEDVTRSVSWASSTPSVATIDASGLATAVGPGKTIITAQSGGITATSDLTVTAPGSSGGTAGTPFITVTPAAGMALAGFDGETAQFLATGSLTGGTAQDLTKSVHWISSNVAVATIDQNGLATAVGSGKTVITAQSGGLTGSSDFTVASSAVQPPVALTVIPGAGATGTFAGETTQFLAIGNLSGGGPKDVTRNVQWVSSDASVATIDQTGLATAVGANTTNNLTTITALGTTPSGTVVTATSGLTVLPSQGTSGPPMLTLIPGTALSAVNGETTQFLALGNLAGGGTTQDLTGSVHWVSSDPSIATVDQNGLATAVGGNSVTGSTTITAMATSTSGNAITATSTLTVQPSNGYATQPTLVIIPSTATASIVGETTQYIAVGNLSGGGPAQDLTDRVRWVSSDVGVATINQAGLATGVGALGGISSSAITAIATTTSGSVITATGMLSMVPGGAVNLPTLTVYKVGLGNGTITSSPAGLICGPQAACTGSFQLNATVTLTATPAAGSSFAGWSANCTPSNSPTCTLTMGNNDTVGAIFNVP